MIFEEEYSRRAVEGGFDILDAGVRLYDVIWVLALALNNTMTMVRNDDISQTGCSNASGSLVPLEEFNYTNEKMGCVIQWNIQQTNFSGGSVSFTHCIIDSDMNLFDRDVFYSINMGQESTIVSDYVNTYLMVSNGHRMLHRMQKYPLHQFQLFPFSALIFLCTCAINNLQ